MENGNGKTIADLISDLITKYPKFIAFFTLSLLFLLGIIAYFFVSHKYFVKTNNFEIKPHTDTVFVEKPLIEQSRPKNAFRNNRKVSENPIIEIKQNDTTIKVTNQPANINTGINNGIIGNENTLNISVDKVQRHLNEKNKALLIQRIEEELRLENKDKSNCISISSISDSEAYKLAEEIFVFLKSQNYKISGGGIGSFQQSPPVIGVEIGFEKFNKNPKKCLEIKVGFFK
jgi:hypothetical protein